MHAVFLILVPREKIFELFVLFNAEKNEYSKNKFFQHLILKYLFHKKNLQSDSP